MSEISETSEVLEPSKPSKLKRIKSNIVLAGAYLVPVAMTGGLMYIAVKTSKTQLDAAKLNLETALISKPS